MASPSGGGGGGGGTGASSESAGGPQALLRRPSRSAMMTSVFSQEVFDNEVVPSSLGSIVPILRVAAEVEPERPRVAYLCTSLIDRLISFLSLILYFIFFFFFF